MLKTLLYLNENLASSIALRYTDYLCKFIPLSLYVTHVEEMDKKDQLGTGWVRHTWEDGIASSGYRLVNRMLQTEKIDCPLAGRPKVFVGDRDKEITYELRNGAYSLFIEGYLNCDDHDKFYDLISSSLYTNTSIPKLIAKNLSISKKCAFLCSGSVDPELLVNKGLKILGDAKFDYEIVYFKYKENDHLTFLNREDGGSHLRETEELLRSAGKKVEEISVLNGTPEQVGEFLKDYALVTSIMPSRKSMLMYVLANSLSSILLVN